MKATINKSRLMKRAWAEYRQSKMGFGWKREMTFAQALRLAWRIEKREVARSAMIENQKAQPMRTKIRHNASINMMIVAQYSNARPSQYFGD